MNKKFNIILIISIIFFVNSFTMDQELESLKRKITLNASLFNCDDPIINLFKNRIASEITIKSSKTIDLFNKRLIIPQNKTLIISTNKSSLCRLKLNVKSKIILKENSKLILKWILLDGKSSNFIFEKNSKVQSDGMSSLINTEKYIDRPKSFFINDKDQKNFEKEPFDYFI